MEISKLLNKLDNFFQKNKSFLKRLSFTLFITIVFLTLLKKNSLFQLKIYSKNNFSSVTFNLFEFGISPYLVAGTIINVFTFFLPFAKDWNKEGNEGKKKLNLIRKISFIAILFLRIFFHLIEKKVVLGYFSWTAFYFLNIGSFISLFFAEILSVFGLGQGFSLILILNNLNSLYKHLFEIFNNEMFKNKTLFSLIFFSLIFFFIFIENLIIEIPFIKAQKKIKDKNSFQVLPFKLNLTGTSALFWQSNIIVFLSLIKKCLIYFFPKIKFLDLFENFFINNFFMKSLFLFLAMLVSAFLIYNPLELSKHLSNHDVYLVKKKPGLKTASFLTLFLFKILFFNFFLFLFIFQFLPFLLFQLFPIKTTMLYIGIKISEIENKIIFPSIIHNLFIVVSLIIDFMKNIEFINQQEEYPSLISKKKVRLL